MRNDTVVERERKSVETRLKGVLVFEIVVIVILAVWLGFTGGFEDLFRKDEGVEPTMGRMVSTCWSNGLIVLGTGEGAMCGTLNAPTDADEGGDAPRVYSVKTADKDAESVKRSYASISENTGRGTVVVLLEDSDEMYKFLEIIGDNAYTLWVYYQGKKITINGNDLTVMEDAMVRMGVPNRNRSDGGEGLKKVEAAKQELEKKRQSWGQ